MASFDSSATTGGARKHAWTYILVDKNVADQLAVSQNDKWTGKSFLAHFILSLYPELTDKGNP